MAVEELASLDGRFEALCRTVMKPEGSVGPMVRRGRFGFSETRGKHPGPAGGRTIRASGTYGKGLVKAYCRESKMCGMTGHTCFALADGNEGVAPRMHTH